MSAVENLRKVINERLNAAVEEILGVCEHTIVVYEEKIVRQRRLLDILLKPDIKLHRTELKQQLVCKQEENEVLLDQQLCIKKRNSILDQEPAKIKEEQEELCTMEGEQLVLKQEGAAEEHPLDQIRIVWVRSESDRKNSVVSEQRSGKQLLPNTSQWLISGSWLQSCSGSSVIVEH
ncbi:hypothetical protein NQZ68_029076 [Dissostichus eleginoides]|nr:hypothetical protein NQZ68_029076 [Dissostichus eleginoides]